MKLPSVTPEQFDAILAGLRLLAREVDAGNVARNDGDIGEIWTNSGEHDGLAYDEIQDLGDRLNERVQP